MRRRPSLGDWRNAEDCEEAQTGLGHRTHTYDVTPREPMKEAQQETETLPSQNQYGCISASSTNLQLLT